MKSYYFSDPDFGWHLKLGELILQSGIPKTDPFSYTMSSYPFVDHEWLSNAIIYFIYSHFGWLLLSVLFSAIAILAIFLQIRYIPLKNRTLLIVLSGLTLSEFVGVRTQVISFFFISILIFIFLNERKFQKYKLFMPFLFFLWANLHGGFAIGIVIFLLFIATKCFIEKKIFFTDLFLFLISLLATFVNPYEWRLWWEVFMQITDSSLRWTIQEWTPSFFWFLPHVWLYVILSLFLVIRFRKKIPLFQKALYLFLLGAGISSVRHIALWSIVAIAPTSKSLSYFEKDTLKFKEGESRLSRAKIFLICFCILSFFILRLPIARGGLGEYPARAVDYLKSHPADGQVFSYHGWGGFLIWNYPEKKVFVDGRMNSWRRNSAPAIESTYAFREYLDFYNGKIDLNTIVGKYGIDTFLLPQSSGGKLPFSKMSQYGSVYKQLNKNKWKIVYQDKTAVIYRNMNGE